MARNKFKVDENGEVFLNGKALPFIQSYFLKSGTVMDPSHEVTITLKADVEIVTLQDKARNNR